MHLPADRQHALKGVGGLFSFQGEGAQGGVPVLEGHGGGGSRFLGFASGGAAGAGQRRHLLIKVNGGIDRGCWGCCEPRWGPRWRLSGLKRSFKCHTTPNSA